MRHLAAWLTVSLAACAPQEPSDTEPTPTSTIFAGNVRVEPGETPTSEVVLTAYDVEEWLDLRQIGPGDDLAYNFEVEGMRSWTGGIVLDDAPGRADTLAPTLVIAEVENAVAVIDPVELSNARVASWEAGIGRNLVAEGAIVLTLVDGAGAPAAGLYPNLFTFGATRGYILSDDGTTIVGSFEGGTASRIPTTTSGRVIVVGDESLIEIATSPAGPVMAMANFWSEPGVIQLADVLVR